MATVTIKMFSLNEIEIVQVLEGCSDTSSDIEEKIKKLLLPVDGFSSEIFETNSGDTVVFINHSNIIYAAISATYNEEN